MIKILIFLILSLAADSVQAQWKAMVFGNAGSLGVLDSTLFAYLSGAGLYRYAPDSANKWIESDTGIRSGHDDKQIQCMTSIGSNYFVGLNGGGIYRSFDKGKNWIVGNKYLMSGFVATLTSINNFLLAGSNGIYKSTDSGVNWTETDSGLINRSVFGMTKMGSILFASTKGGIFRSTDSGASWTLSGNIGDLALVVMGTTLYAPTEQYGIFRSTDSGGHWDTIQTTGWPPFEKSCFATNGKTLFVGTNGPFTGTGHGVYRSTDHGASWDTVNWGLPYLFITSLTVFDTSLVVGFTNDVASMGYLAIRPLSQMTAPPSAVQSVSQPPADTIEVFPNPATGLVTIRSRAAIEQVSVINLLGVDLLDMANVRQSELTLDMSKFPSGTYFLRIETALGNSLRKIVKEE